MKLFMVYNINLDISALSIIPINNEPLVIMSPFNLKNNTEFLPLKLIDFFCYKKNSEEYKGP